MGQTVIASCTFTVSDTPEYFRFYFGEDQNRGTRRSYEFLNTTESGEILISDTNKYSAKKDCGGTIFRINQEVSCTFTCELKREDIQFASNQLDGFKFTHYRDGGLDNISGDCNYTLANSRKLNIVCNFQAAGGRISMRLGSNNSELEVFYYKIASFNTNNQALLEISNVRNMQCLNADGVLLDDIRTSLIASNEILTCSAELRAGLEYETEGVRLRASNIRWVSSSNQNDIFVDCVVNNDPIRPTIACDPIALTAKYEDLDIINSQGDSLESESYLDYDESPISPEFKVFLQGPYNNTTGSMNASLSDVFTGKSLIPVRHPFNNSNSTNGSYYTGSDFVHIDHLPRNAVDWVLVKAIKADSEGEFKATDTEINSVSNTTTVSGNTILVKAGILLSDGRVIDPETINGSSFADPSLLRSLGFGVGTFKFRFYHRNHIATQTEGIYTVSFEDLRGNANYMIDLSTPRTDSNTRQIELETGVYGPRAGDVNQDGSITKVLDFNDILTTNTSAFQYSNIDLNLSGSFGLEDKNEAITSNGKYSVFNGVFVGY